MSAAAAALIASDASKEASYRRSKIGIDVQAHSIVSAHGCAIFVASLPAVAEAPVTNDLSVEVKTQRP